MKSILTISFTLHAVAISSTLAIRAHAPVIHMISDTHLAMEMHLGALPKMQNLHRTASSIADSPKPFSSQSPLVMPAIDRGISLRAELPSVNASLPEVSEQRTDDATAFRLPSHSVAQNSHEASDIHGGHASDAESKENQLPWILSSPAPQYPRVARQKGWTGRVGVHVLISISGSVEQTELLSSSGHSEFDDAALAALRKWRFHPAEKDGHVVEAWVIVPVLFCLNNES